jgi:raffinose/stachyose/melibiose transport system substrate-binding protein
MGGIWGVNANSPNRDAALELAAYSATPEFGQQWTDIKNQIHVMTPITHPEVGSKYLARSIDLETYKMPLTWWQFSPFDAQQPGINQLLPPAAQGVVTGQITSEQAAQSIEDGIRSWYQP